MEYCDSIEPARITRLSARRTTAHSLTRYVSPLALACDQPLGAPGERRVRRLGGVQRKVEQRSGRRIR